MGGHAFQELYTPRMQPDVYFVLKAHFTNKLLYLFEHVSISPHVRNKKDYGDFDVIICAPKGPVAGKPDLQSMQNAIAMQIGAEKHRIRPGGVMYTGVPMPELSISQDGVLAVVESFTDVVSHALEPELPPELPEGLPQKRTSSSMESEAREQVEQGTRGIDESFVPTSLSNNLAGGNHQTNNTDSRRKYVQVDFQICDSPSQFEWKVFCSAYGDLFNMLKIGIQPYGFTLRHSGLHMRIPEADPIDKEASMVFLSNNVELVLRFLDLDYAHYKKGFHTLDELFEYATSSKVFSRLGFVAGGGKTDSEMNTEEAGTVSSTSTLGQYCRKRAPWIHFVDVWLPAHPQLGAESHDTQDTKTRLLDEARNFFDKEQQYWKKLDRFRTNQAETLFWQDVVELIKQIEDPISKSRLNKIIVALQRWVVFSTEFGNSPRPVIAKEAEMDSTKYAQWIQSSEEGGFTKQELLDWIVLHQRECYELDRARTRPERHASVARYKERKASRSARDWFPKMSATFALSFLCGGLVAAWVSKELGV